MCVAASVTYDLVVSHNSLQCTNSPSNTFYDAKVCFANAIYSALSNVYVSLHSAPKMKRVNLGIYGDLNSFTVLSLRHMGMILTCTFLPQPMSVLVTILA